MLILKVLTNQLLQFSCMRFLKLLYISMVRDTSTETSRACFDVCEDMVTGTPDSNIQLKSASVFSPRQASELKDHKSGTYNGEHPERSASMDKPEYQGFLSDSLLTEHIPSRCRRIDTNNEGFRRGSILSTLDS